MWIRLVLASALGASPALQDVNLTWDGATLEVTATASAPLSAANARAQVSGRQLQIALAGAALDQPERTFGREARAPISAHREGDGVALEVPIGNKLECKGPVQISAAGHVLTATLACALRAAAPAATAERPAERRERAERPAPPAEQLREVVQLTPDPLSERPSPAAEPAAAATGAPGGEPAAAPQKPPPAVSLPKDLPRAESTSSAASAAWPVLALLALGAAFALWARKRSGATRIVNIVETASLGPKRSLVIARVGGETLLLGASEAGIHLLTTVHAEAAVQAAEDALAAGLSPAALAREFGEPVSDAPPPALRAPEVDHGQASLLHRLLHHSGKTAATSFEALLAESAEDLDLRRKLEAGVPGRVS